MYALPILAYIPALLRRQHQQQKLRAINGGLLPQAVFKQTSYGEDKGQVDNSYADGMSKAMESCFNFVNIDHGTMRDVTATALMAAPTVVEEA